MLRKSLNLGRVAALLAFGSGAVLMAQGTQTGNLSGTVKEAKTGKSIAGARVVLSTPQGDRETTTNERGIFRFPQLIPGPVSIKVSASGFVGASVATRVGLGETNVTDFPLKGIDEAAATVVVAATANNIDTTDAKDGENFTLSAINDLPINNRTVNNIANLAPGISADANGLTIRGSQNTQVLYLVDGADVADPVTGGFTAQLNEDMLSEVQVLSGGISAEYGRFTGGVVNAVTRSGTNEFTGIARLTVTDPAWNAYNPKDRGAAGTNTFSDTHNVLQNYVVSGPIIKDKLFFVVGYRVNAPFASSTSGQTSAPSIYGGGVHYNATTTDERKDIKIDWQINSNHRVFWQYNKTERDQTGRDYAGLFFGGSTSLATLSNQPNEFSYYTLGYQGQLAPNILLNLHYGNKQEKLGGPGGGGQGGNTPIMIDLGGPNDAGYPNGSGGSFALFDNGYFGPDSDSRPIKNGSASLLWFLSGAGEHELKFGVDWYESSRNAANSQAPNNMIVYFGGWKVDPANGGGTGISNRVFDVNSPGTTFLDLWVPFAGARASNTIWAGYINDKWKYDKNWSFNVGVRVDKFTSKNDIGGSNFDLTTISPRLAIINDWDGRGTWVTQLSFGQYNGAVIQGATDGASVVGNPAEYDYVYLGGDPTQRSSYSNTPFAVYDPSAYRHSNTVDPNLKMPVMQEVAVSVKHQDGERGMWSLSINKRRWKNFVDNFIDLQPNPVDSNDLTNTVLKNDPSLVRDYFGLELQWEKQYTDAFSFGGNVTLSQLRGNYEGGQVGTTDPINNYGALGGTPGAYWKAPTRDQFGGTGPLLADVPVRIRAFSNYIMTLGTGRLNFGAIFSYTSGAPYSKTGTTTLNRLGLADGVPSALGSTYTRYFDLRGGMRFADTYRTDLQIAYDVPVWRKVTFFTQLNLINAFNHQQLATWNTTASGVFADTSNATANRNREPTWTPGSNYGKATGSGNFGLARTITISAGLKF